jgi:hypothetical protein
MDGPVTWPQLYLIAAITVAANGFTGWLVYRVCQVTKDFEIRLTKLEERKK